MVRTGRPKSENVMENTVKVRFDHDLLKRLDEIVAKRRSTRSELIREAVVSIVEMDKENERND